MCEGDRPSRLPRHLAVDLSTHVAAGLQGDLVQAARPASVYPVADPERLRSVVGVGRLGTPRGHERPRRLAATPYGNHTVMPAFARSVARLRHRLPVDRLLLPAATVMLLLGAVFLALAWTEARELRSYSLRHDEVRAHRSAAAVATIVEARWMDLESWVDSVSTPLLVADDDGLRDSLARQLARGGTDPARAWVVVRTDGTFAALAEHRAGSIVDSPIADDVRTFGRVVSGRSRNLTSERMSIGKTGFFAYGVPLRDRFGGHYGAVVMVVQADQSLLDAFISPGRGGPGEVTLVDERGQRLVGPPLARGPGGRVERGVHGTGWKIVLPREEPPSVLPPWAYPAFAALLFAMALAFALQERSSLRLRDARDEQARQVRLLYDLSSRMLHARTIREQAQHLARAALDLVHVDGARMRVAKERDDAGIVAGVALPRSRQYRVAVNGPRGPLGELVAYRASGPILPEERSVLQAAATLGGAAMHTIESLEGERAAAEELQRLDELRSNLLATVAHELRSPLTAVKGVLGLLTMQPDMGEKTLSYVDVAMERTDKLATLIQDLFDCSLIETGQLDIRPERMLASELLDSSLGAQQAARSGELLLSATENLMITVDPVRFDQMVNNLVTNAFRHGKPPVEVAVRPWDNGAMVVVTDEGKGIPEEQRDSIFGKFWQGSSGHARLVEGAGLGLNLVQGLVQLHGGTIRTDATHADGRGARFTAYFPDVVPDQPGSGRRAASSPRDDAQLEAITRIL